MQSYVVDYRYLGLYNRMHYKIPIRSRYYESRYSYQDSMDLRSIPMMLHLYYWYYPQLVLEHCSYQDSLHYHWILSPEVFEW